MLKHFAVHQNDIEKTFLMWDFRFSAFLSIHIITIAIALDKLEVCWKITKFCYPIIRLVLFAFRIRYYLEWMALLLCYQINKEYPEVRFTNKFRFHIWIWQLLTKVKTNSLIETQDVWLIRIQFPSECRKKSCMWTKSISLPVLKQNGEIQWSFHNLAMKRTCSISKNYFI